MSTSPRFRRYTADQRREMLIEAGLACLARGGIAAFTVDKICAEAGASRGLITHHFKSKDGLLSAVYETMYERMFAVALPDYGADLAAMVDAVFADELIEKDALAAWLALWSEVPNNPTLQATHRRYYARYLARATAAIEQAAAGRTLAISTERLALMFVSLIDGLWLERAIDTRRLSRDTARTVCLDMLRAFLR